MRLDAVLRLPPLAVILALQAAVACGGTLPPPKRRVIEGEVADYNFRRYQHVLDIEVFVKDNPAKAHTASYVRAAAERRGRISDADVVSAFVTEYRDKAGVAGGLIKFARRLAQESGYLVEEAKLGGQRVFRVSGHGEAWVFWSSGKYVVKVGGRGVEKVPPGIVKAYGRRYPSRIRDGALEAPLEEDAAPGPTREGKGGEGGKGGKGGKDGKGGEGGEGGKGGG